MIYNWSDGNHCVYKQKTKRSSGTIMSLQEIAETLNKLEEKVANQKLEIMELKDIDYEATIKNLAKELKEKDKEIEELKLQENIWHNLFKEKMETQILSVTKEKEQAIRHQVCEEIRAYLKENLKPIHSKLGCFAEINREDLFDKLDQIEGEE